MKSVRRFINQLWVKCKLIILFICLFTVVFWIDELTGGALKRFGITPRQTDSLPYICFAPFLHGSWQHLVNNIFGFFIFSVLCLTQSVRFYLLSSFCIVVVTGLCVWVFARDAVHIGASGWVYGLWSLSIALAWFKRSFKNLLIALLVIIFYGGMAYGIFPQQSSISFESHLFGALAGILVAYCYGILNRR